MKFFNKPDTLLAYVGLPNINPSEEKILFESISASSLI